MTSLRESKLPTIRFVLRDDKPLNSNNEYSFNFYIRFKGKTIKKPSGLYINPKNWNNKKKTVIGNDKYYQRTYQKLSEKIVEFKNYIITYEARGGKITAQVIDAYFNNKHYDDYFSYYNENIKKKEIEWSKATFGKYNRTSAVLKEFCKGQKIDKLLFIDLNQTFLGNFDRFLIHNKDFSSETAHNYHKNLKTILNIAIADEIINRNPYFGFKCISNNRKIDKIPLNEAEIMMFENVDIPYEKEYLYKSKQFFIFLMNTGLRFSDLFSCKKVDMVVEEIDNEKHISLKIKQEKTKNVVKIPLNHKARMILHRMRNQGEGDHLFCKLSNQVFNRHLKELAELAGIKKDITTHIGRHSFASRLINNKVDIKNVSTLLGHKNLRMTEIYAKSDSKLLHGIVNSI